MVKYYKNPDGDIEIIADEICNIISLEGFESHGSSFEIDEDDVDNHSGDYLLVYPNGEFAICFGDWKYGVQTTTISAEHKFYPTYKGGEICDASDIAGGLQPLCKGYIYWDGHNWVLQELSEETGYEEMENFDYEKTGVWEEVAAGIRRSPAVGNDGKNYWLFETAHQGYNNYLQPR